MNRNRKIAIGAATLVVGATTIGMVSCYSTKAHENISSIVEMQSNASATTIATVADKIQPQILGVSDKSAEQGTPIDLMLGISALDNIDGDITSKLNVSGADFTTFGTQEITYTVTDISGNTSIVKSSLVVTEKILFECDYIRYITADSLSIRDNHSTEAGLITSVGYRDAVTVIATVKDTNWVRVRLSNGTEGYCINDYLSESQPAVKVVVTPTPTVATPVAPSNCTSNCSTDCTSDCTLIPRSQNCPTGNPNGVGW
ncbi:SH3 domain-containing protein [[Clostridium] fimetarium]|uniref:SH3b domain-containing protein n=1 Tax=[Clostridium] fimetarium TaxID=99656 RepID=A0A1I0REC7_9FIRM|nr:SH3 domain-containing protein [[Clostridium] fimetarium]SEW38962.1 protein of unknown function [[Clostridium] fimetarium]